MKRKGIVKDAKGAKGKKKCRKSAGEGDAEDPGGGAETSRARIDARRLRAIRAQGGTRGGGGARELAHAGDDAGQGGRASSFAPQRGARAPSSEDTLPGVPRGEDESNLSNLETARALTTSPAPRCLPPDVAELLMKEAAQSVADGARCDAEGGARAARARGSARRLPRKRLVLRARQPERRQGAGRRGQSGARRAGNDELGRLGRDARGRHRVGGDDGRHGNGGDDGGVFDARVASHTGRRDQCHGQLPRWPLPGWCPRVSCRGDPR